MTKEDTDPIRQQRCTTCGSIVTTLPHKCRDQRTKEDTNAVIGRLRETLLEIEMSARGSGPYARDRDADTLRAIELVCRQRAADVRLARIGVSLEGEVELLREALENLAIDVEMGWGDPHTLSDARAALKAIGGGSGYDEGKRD